MSSLEIYGANADGMVEHVADMRNAFQGAFLVWDTLAKKYLGPFDLATEEKRARAAGEEPDRSGVIRSWELQYDPRLSTGEWTTLVLTFDRVFIPVAHLEWCARAFDETRIGHYGPEMARIFRKMQQDGYRGACFNQTSANQNPWLTRADDDDDEQDGEDGHRPYNIHIDDRHQLFDPSEYGKSKNEVAAARQLVRK